MYPNIQGNDKIAPVADVSTNVNASTYINPPTTTNRLFLSIVVIPIVLAIGAIFSTLLPAETQSQLMLGLPVILWLWFAIAILVCVLTIVASFRVIARLNRASSNANVNANTANKTQ